MNLIINLLYKIISIIDRTNHSPSKIINTYNTRNLWVKTDWGWSDVVQIHQTKPMEQYTIETQKRKLICADKHILYSDGLEVFCDELSVEHSVDTVDGSEQIINIDYSPSRVSMVDITVSNPSHTYYTNGFKSHNTTTTALACLHYLLFNIDKNALVCSNKRKSAVEVIDKMKKIYAEIPYFLKPGIYKWNDAEVVMDNGCRIQAEATTINSGIGNTIHFLILDEFAHIAPNIIDKFYNNIFPVVTAAKAKCAIISTQNGRNLFYRLYMGAKQGDNDYKSFEITWEDVPEWNPETKAWEKRDEKWHRRQIANYGSEEAFNTQFGTNFDIGSNTLISQKYLKKLQPIQFINKEIPGVPYADDWYWHPDFEPLDQLRKEFILTTCDLAEGVGGDYTVFSIYRMVHPGTDDLECIGYFRSNTLPREKCALSIMSLYAIHAHPEHSLLSFERNTYGEIFLKDMNDLLEKADKELQSKGTRLPILLFDTSTIVKYYTESGTKFHYGIKITPGNKTTHCLLFKESFERGRIINNAEQFIYEVENFCDDGSGHYKASFGHDDIVMTAVQLEFAKKELQYKLMRDEFESKQDIEIDNGMWNPYDLDGPIEQTAWDSNSTRLNRYM